MKHLNRGNSMATILLCILFGISISGIKAQQRVTYKADYDHNHYSTETWDKNSVVAGTLFEPSEEMAYPTSPFVPAGVNVIKLTSSGSIIWDQTFQFGEGARCFDVCVVNEALIAVTGIANNELFIATIDASGSLLNNTSVTIDEMQSVGLSIIYSEDQDAFFVAGYKSDDVMDDMGNKKGLLLKFDSSLSLAWSQEINGNSANESVMANDLTEISDVGIFVGGKIELDHPNNSYASLQVLYDFDGLEFWERSIRVSEPANLPHHPEIETSTVFGDAVYDAETEELFVILNAYNEHTFMVERIEDAASSNPSITMLQTNNIDIIVRSSNLAGCAIEFDPEDGNLLIAGIAKKMRYFGTNGNNTGAPVDNSASFLTKVDRNNGNFAWFKQHEASNLYYHTHDNLVFRAFYGTHSFINSPDILSVGQSGGFQFLGYDTFDDNYGLSLMITDQNGDINEAEECERNYSIEQADYTYGIINTEGAPISAETLRPEIEGLEQNHEMDEPCGNVPPIACGFSIEHDNCYDYSYTANSFAVTPGSTIQYEWDWGDGSANTITTAQTVSHIFATYTCQFTVCLTITVIDAIGGQTVEMCCQTLTMDLDYNCVQCFGKRESSIESSGFETANELKIFPNPVSDQLRVEFGQEVENGTVSLLNLMGQTLISRSVLTSNSMTIDVSDLPAGSYILQTEIGIEGAEMISKLITVE